MQHVYLVPSGAWRYQNQWIVGTMCWEPNPERILNHWPISPTLMSCFLPLLGEAKNQLGTLFWILEKIGSLVSLSHPGTRFAFLFTFTLLSNLGFFCSTIWCSFCWWLVLSFGLLLLNNIRLLLLNRETIAVEEREINGLENLTLTQVGTTEIGRDNSVIPSVRGFQETWLSTLCLGLAFSLVWSV